MGEQLSSSHGGPRNCQAKAFAEGFYKCAEVSWKRKGVGMFQLQRLGIFRAFLLLKLDREQFFSQLNTGNPGFWYLGF